MAETVGGIHVFEHDLPDDLAAAVRATGVAAWDTETSGLDPRAGRLQLCCRVFAPSIGSLLVRIYDRRPDRLCELLSDPDVLKVMHHAPFDLAFMHSSWAVDARAVRCTQIASKLVAPGPPPRRTAWRLKCGRCHTVQATLLIGGGLVGRVVGGRAGDVDVRGSDGDRGR